MHDIAYDKPHCYTYAIASNTVRLYGASLANIAAQKKSAVVTLERSESRILKGGGFK